MTRQGARRLDCSCGEHDKLPADTEVTLAERDKFMSEPKSFMKQLDEWTNAAIIVPLSRACYEGDDVEYHDVTASIEKAVREKVLESYHNGQNARPRVSQPRH